MDNREIPLDWSQAEWAAREYVDKAASWLNKFFCDKSSYFYVALNRGKFMPANPDVNSASCLIGTMVDRNLKVLQERPVNDSITELVASTTAMRLVIKAEKPRAVLPLKSFGFLPLFSTAYLAEFLPTCYPDTGDELSTNYAYLISIRRLLSELIGHASSTLERSIPHAFLLSHVVRALRTFEKRSKASTGHFEDICLPQMLFERLTEGLDPHNLGEIKASFNDKLDNEVQPYFTVGLTKLLDECFSIADDLALKAVLTEIANSHRASASADPAALAFGLQTLAESNSQRYASIISQGISLLTEMGRGGFFASGKPFYSDDRGRSLLVPSVETANALVSISLNPELGLSEKLQDAVLETSADVQRRIMEEHNTIGINGTTIEGWCSDRASTPDRIESWVTAHTLEFLVNRVRQIHSIKKQRVFSQYSSMSWTKIKPKWGDLQDPDTGHCDKTVKSKIEAGMSGKNAGTSPVFLLYGPPGTSKTTVAKSAATRKNWDLLLLSPSDFVSESLDKIEYRSRRVFNDLMNVDKCVVIFDEIDTLFRDRRELRRHSAGSILEFVVPALLPKLQDFRDYAMNKEIAVFFLTNFYELIDPAISRGGRIDNHIVVLPYSVDSRLALAQDMYEKALAKGQVNKFGEFAKVLRELPCNLVYRDIELLALEAAAGTNIDADKLDRLAYRLGMKPEVYAFEDRPGGEHEFCMFFSRLINFKFPERDLANPDEMSRFLQDCLTHVKASRNPRYDKWIEIAEDWEKKLR